MTSKSLRLLSVVQHWFERPWRRSNISLQRYGLVALLLFGVVGCQKSSPDPQVDDALARWGRGDLEGLPTFETGYDPVSSPTSAQIWKIAREISGPFSVRRLEAIPPIRGVRGYVYLVTAGGHQEKLVYATTEIDGHVYLPLTRTLMLATRIQSVAKGVSTDPETTRRAVAAYAERMKEVNIARVQSLGGTFGSLAEWASAGRE